MYGIRIPGQTEFMRKGEVGDYKNYFKKNEKVEKLFESWVQQGLEGTDLVFDFGGEGGEHPQEIQSPSVKM